ncbi:hypothetical protein LPTSP3_g03510 [Leptospira kobayashii]|uniref:Lipoprotein n=1 Tax=Leptospira kobayashii TaxID=1917830 RepID=A0ABN6KCT3_9LEPT|nr:hypothetical protein [Leptospira kobayashii]BDA77421.1 hypothetical protein LPTSP3_g03510 [Leptospira kobayashii]
MDLRFNLHSVLTGLVRSVPYIALVFIHCSSVQTVSPGLSSDYEIKNPFIEEEKQSLSLKHRCRVYRILTTEQFDLILRDTKNQTDPILASKLNLDFSKYVFFLVIEFENPYTKNLFELGEVYLNHSMGKLLIFYNYDHSGENEKNNKNDFSAGKSMQYEYFNLTPKQPVFDQNRKTRRYILQFDKNKILDRPNYLDLKMAKDKIRFQF